MPTQWPRLDPGGLANVSLESKSAANHHHSNVIYMLTIGLNELWIRALTPICCLNINYLALKPLSQIGHLSVKLIS